MLDLFRKYKRMKLVCICIAIGAVFLLILFPILSKFFEDSVSSNVISDYAYDSQCVPTSEGGNCYDAITDDESDDNKGSSTGKNKTTEDEISEYLQNSGLWHTSINVSRDAQVLWYKTLSEYLEKTYVQGTPSGGRTAGFYVRKNNYNKFNKCVRNHDGDYSNDECDLNGPVSNIPTLTFSSDLTVFNVCENGVRYYTNVNYNRRVAYYKSNDSIKKVGGKILGLYPDILVNAAMANTYSVTDQNAIYDVTGSSNIMSSLAEVAGSSMPMMSAIANAIYSIISSLADWYNSFQNTASASAALDDTFAEGSLYSTFDFSADSKCKVKDVVGYYKIDKLPCGFGVDDSGTRKELEYVCIKEKDIYTKCEKFENVDSKGNIYYTYENGLISTDGNPDTYYYSTNGTKYCDYVWDGKNAVVQDGLCERYAKGPFYQIQVEWICSPEKPVEDITCTPTPVKDDRDTILYYYCSDVDLGAVRTAIVDKVLDAYEDNSLEYNEFMTYETVNQYIYGFDTSKYVDTINPNNYTIDDDTRNIIAKHVAMEITGQIEGRTPVICDEHGNFALQSYNRVLNIEQFQDSLYETIFIKDNILRKVAADNNVEVDDALLYSEKLFSVYYSPFNPAFDNWSSDKIEEQKILDISRKKSLIMEIFDTYDYVKYYNMTNSNKNGTSGSGLAMADPSGYKTRIKGPVSKSGFYTIGLLGECAWYATGRAREILANAGSDYDWTTNVNGGNFCYTSQAQDFTISNDYSDARVGSIVSWTGGLQGYGHVAIIEKVYDEDGDGKVDFVDISEGGVSFSGTPATSVWNGLVSRQSVCGSGQCFNYRTHVPISFLRNYSSNTGSTKYKFACYIHLLKDANNTSNTDETDDPNEEPDIEENPEDSNDIISTISSMFNNDMINYYNYLTYTEGGSQINSSNLKSESFLFQNVDIVGTIEVGSMLSVDPGLYIGENGSTYSVTIGGKKYNAEIKLGKTIPKWMTLYKWAKDYETHYSLALGYIKNNLSSGKQSEFNSINKVHFIMRYMYTYGPYSSVVSNILKVYNNSDKYGLWCEISQYLRSGQTYYLNYMNLAEMNMDLFLGNGYNRNPGYTFKYYSEAWADSLVSESVLARKSAYSSPKYESYKASGKITFSSNASYKCGG